MNYKDRLQEFLDELYLFQDWMERYEYIINLGKKLPTFPEEFKTEDRLIKGCQSKVWLATSYQDGCLVLQADSDSLITKGLIAIFVRLFSHLPIQEVIDADLTPLEQSGLREHLVPMRANALHTMSSQIKEAAKAMI